MAGEVSVLRSHLSELEGVDGACPVCSTRLEQVTKDVLIQERRTRIANFTEQISHLENLAGDLRTDKVNLQKVHERQKLLFQKIDRESELRKKERENMIKLSELRGRRAAFTESFSQISNRASNLDKEIETLEIERRKLIGQKKNFEVKIKKDKKKKKKEK